MLAKSLVALAAVAALTSAASAGPVLLATTSQGTVLQADPATGQFSTFGFFSCAPVSSLAVSGSNLILGDEGGTVWIFDLQTQQTVNFFSVSAPVQALAIDGQDILVSTQGRKIHRLNQQTGTIISTRTLLQEAHALEVSGSTLYAGGLSSFVYKGDVASGPFTLLTVCGGAVQSMDSHSNFVLLGTAGQNVYRVNNITGSYYNQFPLPEPQTAIVMNGEDALISSPTGLVRRVNPATGAVLATYNAGAPITDMIMIPGFPCAADFDGSGSLNVNDFMAFANGFAARIPAADFNQDTLYNVNDFIAYQNAYAAGCP